MNNNVTITKTNFADVKTDIESLPVYNKYYERLRSFVDANVTGDGTISSDTISEYTSGSGVTIDGVLLKDGLIAPSDAAVTTQTVIDIAGLAAITTGIGLHVDATGVTQTSGKLIYADSASTALTSAGRLILSDHTGATTVSGILNEFKSAATDETEIMKITASGALAAGKCLNISAAAMTTGTGLMIDSADALTTGILVDVESGATAITGAGRLLSVDHSGATTTSGTLVEFKTAANDETVLASYSAASLTTGKVISITSNSLTTGAAIYVNAGSDGIALQSAANLVIDMPVPSVGADITTATAPAYWIPYGKKGDSGMTVTEFYIDLTGLSSVADDGDVIGDTGETTSATLGQYTVAVMGTAAAIEVVCLEAPAGGTADIDLYSHATGTLSIDDDAAAAGTQLIAAGGAWTNGAVKGATSMPTANHYFYLTAGTAAAGDYTAGKFIIRIYGT